MFLPLSENKGKKQLLIKSIIY